MTDPYSDLRQLARAAEQHTTMVEPAEVRRLAGRRQRNQVLAWTGAAAVVVAAVTVTGISNSAHLLGSERDLQPAGPSATSSTPAQTTATTTPSSPAQEPDWVTTIPTGFPLLEYIDDPGGDGDIDGPAETVPMIPVQPCDRPNAWMTPEQSTDQLAVRSNIPENTQIRQLVLLPDDEAASAAIEDVTKAYAGCTTYTEVPGGFSQRYETRALDIADQAFSVSVRYEFDQAPAIGRTEMRWVRVGNAVSFTFDTSEAMSDSEDPLRQSDRLVGQLADEMCVFAEDPCEG